MDTATSGAYVSMSGHDKAFQHCSDVVSDCCLLLTDDLISLTSCAYVAHDRLHVAMVSAGTLVAMELHVHPTLLDLPDYLTR